MVIKDVKVQQAGKKVVLSANCKIRKIGWDRIFFSTDLANKDFICSDASPFAAALLLPSMKQGEDLIIKGSISRQLLAGMYDIMNEVLAWDIHLKRINIIADGLLEDQLKPKRTAAYFTGGVDSFYTYLKHKDDRIKKNRIDSFIFVKGFDIKLDDETLWDLTIKNIEAIAHAENVQVVAIESNLRNIIEPMLMRDFIWFSPWDYIHGSSLAATGLFVRGEFRRIYVPSTFTTETQIPWGSHLALDKHWSTETLQFVHDGAEANRINKLAWQVSQSPIALKHLRVCYVNTDGKYNCGTCDKCLRTMVGLYAVGVLEKAATFPHTLDLTRIAAGPYHVGDGQLILFGEKLNLQALQDSNRNPLLQKAVQAGINNALSRQESLLDKLKIIILKITAKASYVDHAYFGGQARLALLRLPGSISSIFSRLRSSTFLTDLTHVQKSGTSS